MRIYKKLACLVFVLSTLSACSLYRPDLEQGNYIEQASLDTLEPNLTKMQVEKIIGSPALTPAANLNDWNYTYVSVPGKQRHKNIEFQTLTLHFKNDKLKSYSSKHWHLKNLPKKDFQ